MSEQTAIQWCDSTLNLMMGCDGCELWTGRQGSGVGGQGSGSRNLKPQTSNLKPAVRHCYAGTLTERMGGGNKGWPESFDKPVLFLDRLDAALKWKDLTGTKRADKPWLDGMPRLIFMNDMGDTFTESLPLDWLSPLLPRMAASPHQWLILTKRPKRAAEFVNQFLKTRPTTRTVHMCADVAGLLANKMFDFLLDDDGNKLSAIEAEKQLKLLLAKGVKVIPASGGCEGFSDQTGCPGHKYPVQGWPANIWLGTSVTDRATLSRIDALPDVPMKFVSIEPQIEAVSLEGRLIHFGDEGTNSYNLNWVIVGGESGHGARRFDLAWARSLRYECAGMSVPFFFKQAGVNTITDGRKLAFQPKASSHGDDMSEWPADLRVRQMPFVVSTFSNIEAAR